MIFVTHGVVGGALGAAMRTHPLLAFTAGFASHFILDAFPHWQYKLESITHDPKSALSGDFAIGKKFFFDLIKIGTDFLASLVITLIVIHGDVSSLKEFLTEGIFWGMMGGIVPDALQFLYAKWKHEPLTSLQRFHQWIHVSKDKERTGWYPLGIFLQVAIIVSAIYISTML